MRRREIAGDREAALELLVRMKLGAIVEGDGLEELGLEGNDPAEGRSDFAGGSVADFSQLRIACFSVYDSKDTFELVGAHDGIGLPVAELGPVVGA